MPALYTFTGMSEDEKKAVGYVLVFTCGWVTVAAVLAIVFMATHW